MNTKDKLTLKWIIIITVILIAVAVMYYQNRPIKEVEEPVIKQYRMKVKPIIDQIMFLDDELLEICRNAKIEKPEQVSELFETLCRKCENHYKSKIKENMTNKEVKTILDRTFNIWDSFTRQAIKEGGNVAIIGEILSKYTFKKEFLKNEELKRVYETL